MVIDQDGQLEPLERDRLFITIHDSCKHRPTATSDAGALTKIILGQVMDQVQHGRIQRQNIAKAAHQVLQRFDKAAAAVYAAYHPTSS